MATTPIKNLRLRRTQQSTIYEVVSAAILLVMWTIGIVAIARHKADNIILIVLTFISIGVVVLHLVSYRPTQHWARNDFEIKTVRQAVVASKFYRILAIEIAIFGLFIAIDGLTHFKNKIPEVIKGGTIVSIVSVTHIAANRKLKKVREAEKLEQQQKNAER